MAKITLEQIIKAYGINTDGDTYDCTELDPRTSEAIQDCMMASAGIARLNHRLSVAKGCALVWQKSIEDDCAELALAHKKHNQQRIQTAEHKLMFSSIGYENVRKEIKTLKYAAEQLRTHSKTAFMELLHRYEQIQAANKKADKPAEEHITTLNLSRQGVLVLLKKLSEELKAKPNTQTFTVSIGSKTK